MSICKWVKLEIGRIVIYLICCDIIRVWYKIIIRKSSENIKKVELIGFRFYLGVGYKEKKGI